MRQAGQTRRVPWPVVEAVVPKMEVPPWRGALQAELTTPLVGAPPLMLQVLLPESATKGSTQDQC